MKCGIEIHQRICSRKLFCDCDATMSDQNIVNVFTRILHPAVGETGEVDRAVAFEDSRKKEFKYLVKGDSACLVETDSEPPHGVNKEALITALSVAKHLNMFVPPEIHVMRKTVIDGSNTGGFQRTMVVGLGTKNSIILTSEGPVRVKDLELEEESARIVKRTVKGVTYDLSGLGIPLIEIGTHPDIKSPQQAYETALFLGELLRLTGKAQRGIGSIRQDVNVSVKGGARVEIKGFQELKDLPKLIENEVKRQEFLISLAKELTGYKLRRVNVSEFFEKTKIFKNKQVMGLVLPGFKGILARKMNESKTLGSELADYARAYGVKGLIHSDENLKKYGLTAEFMQAGNELGLDSDDLLLVIAGKDEVINPALSAVEERVYLLNDGVPEETRVASKDATSVYARPLPGGARMYPETDVPLILSKDYKSFKIESKAKRVNELKSYGLTRELIKELVLSPRLDLFKDLVKKHKGLGPLLIARILITVPKDVKKRHGKDVSVLTDKHFTDLFSFMSEGRIVSDAVPELLAELSDAPELEVKDLLGNYRRIGTSKLVKLIKKIVKDNKGLSFKQYMGMVMKEVRGRESGDKIAIVLKEVLDK